VNFAGSYGFYLNGLNENILSIGLPLQLGVEINFFKMAVDIFAEAGIGIGMASFTERQSPLLEWYYGGTGEFYFPGKRYGLGLSFGMTDSLALHISDWPPAEPFRTIYTRFAFILRGASKFSLYAQIHGSGHWVFGLQWRKTW
jgi:hypothetical protein